MQIKVVITIASISLLLTVAIAGVHWTINDAGNEQIVEKPQRGESLPITFDQSLSLQARLRALEQAVSDERYARQLLQDELFVLTGEIDALTAERQEGPSPNVSAAAERDPAGRRGPSASNSRNDERRIERLVEAGFSHGQAQWILERESQLQMEALQARYDAERTGDASGFFRSRLASGDALRSELGDAEYERYLNAAGRSTSVAVSGVLDSSPAQRAGLRPGDRIVSYDGRRVFSMNDLTRQTMQGQPGEQVVVDVVRDGVTMQFVMPRGPVGISGGRRFAP